mmetsp:Transcript_43107/g.131296  ORF Transcript_43107/g.131296 Transcript_43107/m.131296 type:complete len:246 (-) Transcript_43107:1212-1949(-)
MSSPLLLLPVPVPSPPSFPSAPSPSLFSLRFFSFLLHSFSCSASHRPRLPDSPRGTAVWPCPSRKSSSSRYLVCHTASALSHSKSIRLRAATWAQSSLFRCRAERHAVAKEHSFRYALFSLSSLPASSSSSSSPSLLSSPSSLRSSLLSCESSCLSALSALPAAEATATDVVFAGGSFPSPSPRRKNVSPVSQRTFAILVYCSHHLPPFPSSSMESTISSPASSTACLPSSTSPAASSSLDLAFS